MNLKPVQIRLSIDEVSEILSITLDDNCEHALHFIKTVLASQVEKSLQRH